MDMVVIGAGIVGLSTARQLRKDGHRGTVINCGTEIGGGTSFANGGQLSYRHVAPLAAPNMLAKLPACMLRTGAAVPLRPLGIGLPIYSVEGYSLSLPVRDGAALPETSVTDFQHKVVYAGLGNQLRVAGMADIFGHDETLAEDRLGTLQRKTLPLFGRGVDAAQAVPWSGLRKATPTGRPIIGASGVDGIWLNSGHGALGFTLVAGSAALVADRIAAQQSERKQCLPSKVTVGADPKWQRRPAYAKLGALSARPQDGACRQTRSEPFDSKCAYKGDAR